MNTTARPIQASNVAQYLKEKINVLKMHPNAVFPYRENEKDIGLDITLIGRVENRAEDETYHVNCFSTGLAVKPPDGYYFEMFARSSLHKHGYTLATGTSIIDPEYRGELIVPLYKYQESEDLEMPFRAVQIILKPIVYAHMQSVRSLDSTTRGDNGFGSTGFAPPSFGQNDDNFQMVNGGGSSSKSKSVSSRRANMF